MADAVVEHFVPSGPVEGLDDGATQGVVARVLIRVGMVAHALIVHVEIGVHETGLQVGGEVEPCRQGGFERWRVPGDQDPVELAYRHLDEIHFVRDEGIPARGVLGDEFQLDAVGERWHLAVQTVQAQPALAGRIVAFSFEVEGFPAKALVAGQNGPCRVELRQSIGAGADGSNGELGSMGVNRLARYDGRKAVGQGVRQLGIRRDQLNLQGAVVERAEAWDLLLVISATILPVVQADDPPLPHPGSLGAGLRIEVAQDGIHDIRSPHGPTPALRESGVVDELHARLDANRVDEAVG